MSDDGDKEGRTEEASPRRIEEAREKGNTPFSRELSHIASFLLIGSMLPYAASYMIGHLAPAFLLLLDRPHEIRLETSEDALALLMVLGSSVGFAVLPVVIGLSMAGVFAALAQNSPRAVLQRIKPQASRISPSKGMRRIFGAAGLMESGKAIAKIIISAIALYWFALRAPERVLVLAQMNPADLSRDALAEVARLFLDVGAFLTALATLDLIWSRMKWHRDLRMTRQEVKDEHKQMEGDPIVRARQRAVARSLARRRMMASVPRATLVVANPTHYAVALRYVHGETAAPIVVAKGIDHLALRIRAIAEERAIPVIEDRDLARSLYSAVKTDRQIPAEFYRAVAEIILHVMSRPTGRWAS